MVRFDQRFGHLGIGIILVVCLFTACQKKADPAGPDEICVTEPRRIDYGVVPLGTQVDREFKLRNYGKGSAHVEARLESDHFSIVTGSGRRELGSGDSLTIGVRYHPQAAGHHSCVVEFGSNCDLLTCVGEAQPPPRCAIDPDSLDFGLVPLYESVDLQFTVRNVGGFVLEGDISEGCSVFSIMYGGGPFSLPSGSIRTVFVRYRPTYGGIHTCGIDVSSGCAVICLGRCE